MIDDNSNNSESIPKQEEELLPEIPLEEIIHETPIDEPSEETIPIIKSKAKSRPKGRPKESKERYNGEVIGHVKVRVAPKLWRKVVCHVYPAHQDIVRPRRGTRLRRRRTDRRRRIVQ